MVGYKTIAFLIGDTMKEFFVVSDVHSFYDEMIKALDDAGFDINNKNHIFVSCGDLLDRGPDPEKCLDFVNDLPDNRKILILGNHEDLMIEAIYRESFLYHDYHNRTNETVFKLFGVNPDDSYGNSYLIYSALSAMKTNEKWVKYINSCINYYETEKYIFVHGYIPIGYDSEEFDQCYLPTWRDDFSDWSSARWLNGMSMWRKGIKEPNKTIICGHWHSSYGHSIIDNNGPEFKKDSQDNLISIHTPFYGDGIIAIDACTAYSGFVNCIKLEVEDE